jgi:hypothetical protein
MASATKIYEIFKPIHYRYTCQKCKKNIDWQDGGLYSSDSEIMGSIQAYGYDISEKRENKLRKKMEWLLDESEKKIKKAQPYKIDIWKRTSENLFTFDSIGVCPYCKKTQFWAKANTLDLIGFALLITGIFFLIIFYLLGTIFLLKFASIIVTIIGICIKVIALICFNIIKRQNRKGNGTSLEIDLGSTTDSKIFIRFEGPVKSVYKFPSSK